MLKQLSAAHASGSAVLLRRLGGGEESGVGSGDVFWRRLVAGDPTVGQLWGGWPLKRGFDQGLGLGGQAGAGVQDSYPRCVAAGMPLWLLVREASQSAQMTPVGAREVATI